MADMNDKIGGKVGERLKPSGLNPEEPQGSAGSNPALSARRMPSRDECEEHARQVNPNGSEDQIREHADKLMDWFRRHYGDLR